MIMMNQEVFHGKSIYRIGYNGRTISWVQMTVCDSMCEKMAGTDLSSQQNIISNRTQI